MTDVTYILYIINKYLNKHSPALGQSLETVKNTLIAKIKYIKKRQLQRTTKSFSMAHCKYNTIPKLR